MSVKPICQSYSRNWEEFYRRVKPLVVYTYARSGILYFKRLFDQHPQVVSVTRELYDYHHLIDIFGPGQNRIDIDVLIDRLVQLSNYSLILNPMSESVKDSVIAIGDCTKGTIDGKEFFSILRAILPETSITRKQAILALHFTYSTLLKEDTSKIKYILLAEAAFSNACQDIFDYIETDFDNQALFIHLCRSLLSGFASNKVVYCNAYGSLFYLDKKTFKVQCVFNDLITKIGSGINISKNLRTTVRDRHITLRTEEINRDLRAALLPLIEKAKLVNIWSSKSKITITSMGHPWVGYSAYTDKFAAGDSPLAAILEQTMGKELVKSVPEKWRLVLNQWEVNFIEQIFSSEILETGYLVQDGQNADVSQKLTFFKPIKGEWPTLYWWISISKDAKCMRVITRRILLRLVYIILFTVGYVKTRLFICRILLGQNHV